MRSFGKLNQQFKINLKRKFLVSSEPKKTQFLGFIKLLSRLRLHFSHLNEHKFPHNFRAIDPMCSCGLEPETALHYLLHCNLYSDLRAELLNDACA